MVEVCRRQTGGAGREDIRDGALLRGVAPRHGRRLHVRVLRDAGARVDGARPLPHGQVHDAGQALPPPDLRLCQEVRLERRHRR